MEWSDMGHAAFVEALSTTLTVAPEKLAFHGGMSLHLSWRSPRISENLDFLLSRDFASSVSQAMPKIRRRLEATMRAVDPGLKIEIADKTRKGSRLLDYMVAIFHREHIGVTNIKARFWQVEPDYLKSIETAFVVPTSAADVGSMIRQPIPAITLQAAFGDKLTAFASRAHLKWCDLFDLWWIGQTINLASPEATDRFLHHVAGYRTIEGLPPAEALRKFTVRDRAGIAAKADPELRKSLPRELWRTLKGRGVDEVVAYVMSTLDKVASEIEVRHQASKPEVFSDEHIEH